jgi:sterol 14-demethylase
MGLFAAILDRFCEQCSTQSVSVVAGLGFLTLIVLSVLTNVLVQLLFKNPNEPPVVFHWFPFIGSTVTYGIDPYKFFFNARKKVRTDYNFFCSTGSRPHN